jgi:coniferyl-aldehyde dehydrogenase
MISQSAWNRMQEFVDDAGTRGAQIIHAGSFEASDTYGSHSFPPTLIVGADDSMRIMQEEIFGPILPVVTYTSLDEALTFINARPHPLALYYFDSDRSRIRQVLDQTTSGGAAINDCIFQFAQHRLPFGGVGPSGMGAYHGFEGFKTFSKQKGVFLQSPLAGSLLDKLLKPPYSPKTHRVIALLLGRTTTRPVRKITLP